MSMCLGHHIDTSLEPNPEGDLLRKDEKLYRVQYLNIDQPESGKEEIQIRCISCGEEVTLKVLSRSTQVTQAILVKIGTVVMFFVLAFVAVLIADLIFHTSVTYTTIGGLFAFTLLSYGILGRSASSLVPALSITADRSKKHTVLEREEEKYKLITPAQRVQAATMLPKSWTEE